jgi:glycosyltransferase involved in cell wall biosynthesis
MPMRLSFCMIVKNEATNLPRCLASVQSIADELIVLDTGSTDNSIAIAQSFGARVEQYSWNHNFATARNIALTYVTGDWVLVLDADEVLAPEVVPALKQAMQNEQALVINLIRQEIGAVQSPYSLVSRLFRHHPDLCFSRPYHAMIDDSVAQLLRHQPHWQIVNCPQVAILHYGYDPTQISSRNKSETARLAMESFQAEHPHDPYVCSKLGALYVQNGQLEQGIALLESGLNHSNATDASILYELHYHLGIAYSRTTDLAQAEQNYQAAIAQPILAALKLGAYNNLGSLYQTKGDYASAQQIYQTCLSIDPAFATAHYNLGMVLKAQGQLNQALAHYETALQLNPNHADSHQNFGVVLLKLGRVPESLAAFRQAIALHESTKPSEAIRLRQGLKELGLSL